MSLIKYIIKKIENEMSRGSKWQKRQFHIMRHKTFYRASNQIELFLKSETEGWIKDSTHKFTKQYAHYIWYNKSNKDWEFKVAFHTTYSIWPKSKLPIKQQLEKSFHVAKIYQDFLIQSESRIVNVLI